MNRVIGRVAGDGTVDTSTALTDAPDGNNVRSAASIDGTSFWVTGGAGGVRYASALGATTSTQLSTSGTNFRQVAIFPTPANQLYVSSSSGATIRLGTVGSGTPTTPGQTISNLPGFPVTGSPYAFSFLDVDGNGAVDTLYVADDTAGPDPEVRAVGRQLDGQGAITASSVRGPGEGTGLGLAQVHGLIAQHEGSRRRLEHPGQGTTISLWLPAADAPGSPPGRANPSGTAKPSDIPKGRGAGRRRRPGSSSGDGQSRQLAGLHRHGGGIRRDCMFDPGGRDQQGGGRRQRRHDAGHGGRELAQEVAGRWPHIPASW